MAEDDKKRMPNMPANSWWALRKKLRTTMPARVTTSYLASVLNMSQDSASNNILPSLKMTGLIDDEGKPTERAVRWRDDNQYSQVCLEIRDEVFPQELRDLAPTGSVDKSSVKSWLANHLRVGDNAASKISSFYALLTEADVSKEISNSISASDDNRSRAKVTSIQKPPPNKPVVSDTMHESSPPANDVRGTSHKQPSVHIDIQIHISPESSPEQIDQIFSSMAKHLREFS